MSEDVSGWTATKKLKHNILKRAFNEYRGAEAILKIQWLLAQERHKNEGFSAALKIFEQKYGDQPRSIRMLNLIAEKSGSDTTYRQTEPPKNFIDVLRQPKAWRIDLTGMELPSVIKRPTANAFMYDESERHIPFDAAQKTRVAFSLIPTLH